MIKLISGIIILTIAMPWAAASADSQSPQQDAVVEVLQEGSDSSSFDTSIDSRNLDKMDQRRRMDALDRQMAEFQRSINRLDSALDRLETSFDDMERKLSRADDRVDDLANDVRDTQRRIGR